MPRREQLVLRPGYGWGVYLVGAVAGAISMWGIRLSAKGASFSDGSRFVSIGVVVAAFAASFIGTRLVFETEAQVFRGYRRRFGRREPLFEIALERVHDVGTTVHSDNDGDACWVTLFLEDGQTHRIPQRQFQIFSSLDADLIALRKWFLTRRYGAVLPSELPDYPPSLDDAPPTPSGES